MNAEKQRIAIAEACGWSAIGMFNGNPKQPAGYPPGINFRYEGLPDYLNDLNAMANAVNSRLKMFDDGAAYLDNLRRVTCESYELEEPIAIWSLTHATARQRAEAFLRTIGKWTE